MPNRRLPWTGASENKAMLHPAKGIVKLFTTYALFLLFHPLDHLFSVNKPDLVSDEF